MYRIDFFNVDPDFQYLSEMMIPKNKVFSATFLPPDTEEEFNMIAIAFEYEGYLYRLYKDDEMYAEGIYTVDSLYDDIM